MGRGFDETGIKGAYIVTLGDTAGCRFVPLDTPRFFDLEAPVNGDAAAAVAALLPAAETQDYYRLTLTGECETPDLPALSAAFSHVPHLTLRDRTNPPMDLWENAGEDSFQGTLFALLKEQTGENPETARLAAQICRRLLNNQEVSLP